jgi:hypothetical protein
VTAISISLALAPTASLAQAAPQTLVDVEAQCVAFPTDCATLMQGFLATQQSLLTVEDYEALLRQATTTMVSIVESNPEIEAEVDAPLQVISDEAEELGTDTADEIVVYITVVTDDDPSNDPVEPLNPSPN